MQDFSASFSKENSQSQSYSSTSSPNSFLLRMLEGYRVIRQRQRIINQYDETVDIDQSSQQQKSCTFQTVLHESQNYEEQALNSSNSYDQNYMVKKNQNILQQLQKEYNQQIQRSLERQLTNKNTFYTQNQNYTFQQLINQQKLETKFNQRMLSVQNDFNDIQNLSRFSFQTNSKSETTSWTISNQSQKSVSLSDQNQSSLINFEQTHLLPDEIQQSASLIDFSVNIKKVTLFQQDSNSLSLCHSLSNNQTILTNGYDLFEQTQIQSKSKVTSNEFIKKQSFNLLSLQQQQKQYQREKKQKQAQSTKGQQAILQKLLQFQSQNENSNSNSSKLSQQQKYLKLSLKKQQISSNFISYKENLQQLLQTLQIQKKMFGQKDQNYQETFKNLGIFYYKNNQYDFALKNYNENLKLINISQVKINMKKEVNLNQIVLLNNIGIVHFSLGNFSKALNYYKKVYKIISNNNDSIISSKSMYLSSTLINIGNVHQQIGCYEFSKSYYEQTLNLHLFSNVKQQQIQEQKIKQIHISACYNNIGVNYFNIGNYASARQYYQKSLKIKQKVCFQSQLYKEFYSNTLNNLGVLSQRQYDYQKALQYYKKSLKQYKKCFEDQSLDQAMILNNIGNIYLQKDQHEEALQYYLRSLSIKQKILGQCNQIIAGSLNNIGVVHFKRMKYDDALTNWHQVQQTKLKQLKQSKNIQHFMIETQSSLEFKSLIKIYSNIGRAYCQKREYQKSLQYFYKERQILKSKNDQNNQKQLLKQKCKENQNFDQQNFWNHINIGNVNKLINEYDIALQNYLQALKLIEKIQFFQKRNIEQAQLLNTIGIVYLNKSAKYQNQLFIDEALTFFQKSKDIYENILSYNKKKQSCRQNQLKINLNYANVLQNYARAFQYKKLFDKALQIYFQVLDLKESFFENYALEYAKTIKNIGNTYFYLCQYDKSEQYYLKSNEVLKKQNYINLKKKIQHKKNEEYHLFKGQIFHNLGNLYFKRKKFQKSFENYEKALQTWKKQMQLIQKNSCYNMLNRKDIEFFLSISEKGYNNARFILELDLQDKNKNKLSQRQIILKVKQIMNSFIFF